MLEHVSTESLREYTIEDFGPKGINERREEFIAKVASLAQEPMIVSTVWQRQTNQERSGLFGSFGLDKYEIDVEYCQDALGRFAAVTVARPPKKVLDFEGKIHKPRPRRTFFAGDEPARPVVNVMSMLDEPEIYERMRFALLAETLRPSPLPEFDEKVKIQDYTEFTVLDPSGKLCYSVVRPDLPTENQKYSIPKHEALMTLLDRCLRV